MNDLKSLRKELQASFFEDGIFDIFFGLMFLFFGIIRLSFIISDWIWGFYILLISSIMVTSFFFLVKRFIIAPRFGIVKLKRMTKGDYIPLVIIICVASTYVILSILDFKGLAAAICYGLLFGSLFVSLAYFTGPKRFYIIAILYGTSFFLVELSNAFIIDPFIGPIVFIIFGTIYASYGTLLFLRFLRKYPLQKQGDIA